MSVKRVTFWRGLRIAADIDVCCIGKDICCIVLQYYCCFGLSRRKDFGNIYTVINPVIFNFYPFNSTALSIVICLSVCEHIKYTYTPVNPAAKSF